MVRRSGCAGALLGGVLLFGTPIGAQTVNQSTFTGTVASASAQLAPSSSGTVFTVPSSGFFVLTEACFTRPGQMTLSGNTFGEVPHSLRNRRKCTRYRLGVALPANEVLTCTNTVAASTQSCTITGDLVVN